MAASRRATCFTAAWTSGRSMCACFSSGHRLVHHFHEMSYFVNHAARFRGVLALHDVMHAAQTEAFDGGAHIVSTGDGADHPLDLDGATFARLSVFANNELLAEMMPAVLFHGLAVTNFLACYFFAHLNRTHRFAGLPAADFVYCFGTSFSHVSSVFQAEQRGKGGFYDVMRIRCAK